METIKDMAIACLASLSWPIRKPQERNPQQA